MEEKLNFPVFKKPLPGPPILTMDQYVQFVEFFVKHLLNLEAYHEEKKHALVDVPFQLK